ncbi:MAG: cytochrome c oxidase subunit II [Candidatus Latescibacteria bacterium]|jgi:cytochrome c oxidase subunit II|nr:cytochrome c oxidase subunit II [Candidatus Latescibacterota bacterium]MBT4136659.1 cytochrome c oxidase subunit II [Candidatus Latescibacterota bacterium]MBT5828694.1 cytochrome c oxidase subunit II [Candidatus Latescibacterota bacterium]
MWTDFPLFPEQASSFALKVDGIYFATVLLSVFFAALVSVLVIIFAIKYRRKSPDEIPRQIAGHIGLEIFWTAIPLVLALGMFVWSTVLYFHITTPPANTLEMYVVGKQWMWKLQHPEGKREINELHVPLGQPVRLTMTSEDVLHSFYIPAFRVKKDVVPGRYTSLWFEATKIGSYHLFCAEYCGTEHSRMIGKVHVMEPQDYQNWLTGGVANEPMEVAGERLFEQYACHTCHKVDGKGRGPSLVGLYGKSVGLEGGGSAVVNEAYIRESILNPAVKLVAGYKPIMPTFKGQISEEGVMQLIAYVKSLKAPELTSVE